MIGFSMGQRQHLQQRISQRLSVSQRQALNTVQLALRRGLVDALNGEHYEPRAVCTKCGHALTDLEIMKGFNDDPNDYTTGCPLCSTRFQPRMVHRAIGGTIERAFYCPMQTLDRLTGLENTPLAELMSGENASVYYSAVAHFGGIKQAFRKLGLEYAYASDLEWKKIVEPFLGKMADSVIAELVGSTSSAVGRLRQRKGIARYSRKREEE